MLGTTRWKRYLLPSLLASPAAPNPPWSQLPSALFCRVGAHPTTLLLARTRFSRADFFFLAKLSERDGRLPGNARGAKRDGRLWITQFFGSREMAYGRDPYRYTRMAAMKDRGSHRSIPVEVPRFKKLTHRERLTKRLPEALYTHTYTVTDSEKTPQSPTGGASRLTSRSFSRNQRWPPQRPVSD